MIVLRLMSRNSNQWYWRLSCFGFVLDLHRLLVDTNEFSHKHEILGFLFQRRPSPILLMKPVLVMREVGEEARLVVFVKTNVAHVLTEFKKIKYKMQAGCNPKLHIPNPQYQAANVT